MHTYTHMHTHIQALDLTLSSSGPSPCPSSAHISLRTFLCCPSHPTFFHRLLALPTFLPSIHQLHPASPRGSSLLVLSHLLGLPSGKVSASPLGPVLLPLCQPPLTGPFLASRHQSFSFQQLLHCARTSSSSRTSRVSGLGACTT